MNIFIDAYNLLKQLHMVTHVAASHKHLFAEQLKQFARTKGHHIYLVYDGGESRRSESHQSGPLATIHSGYTLTADDVIKQKIIHYAPEHTLLVSDDHQLCDYVAAAGFAALGTADFYEIMKADTRKAHATCIKQGVAHKNPGYVSTPELDELMQQAGSTAYYKEEAVVARTRSTPLSKKEKKLSKLIKKL